MDNDVKDDARQRVEEELNTQKRSRLIGVRYSDSRKIVPNVQLIPDLLTVPEMRELHVAPLARDNGRITFAMTINTPQTALRELRQRFSDFNVSFAIISNSGFFELMVRYDPPPVINYDDVEIATGGESATIESVSRTFETVKSDSVLNYLITQAERQGASDIHLEVEREYVRLRFRIDGALHAVAHISHDKYRQLSSSIAVLADISTSAPEPQTGHITYDVKRADGTPKSLNMRIETSPTLYGQDAVIRLFNFERSLLKLDNLGISRQQTTVLQELVSHPHGLVMVVGPTGSGKTTTLYALIDELNDAQRKIVTLEDPIEYDFEGVSQIPVKSSRKETFADRLRAVLRLDPDVIMVGEIRDEDTARTAMQASLTGHLVLTTFHATNAATALARMIETIGDNPLFFSAVRLIVGQRLVRRLDENKQPYQPNELIAADIRATLETLPNSVEKPTLDTITLYHPAVTEGSPFGYKGRAMISEQLHMTPEMQRLLRESGLRTSAAIIQELAQKQGMLTMKQDGILKALSGLTSIEEVYRVID